MKMAKIMKENIVMKERRNRINNREKHNNVINGNIENSKIMK
jgi:hypothetical protein